MEDKKTLDNPFQHVREEVRTHMEGDTKCVDTDYFDHFDRKVGFVRAREYADGRKGHCAEFVDSDGYWRGGCGEDQPDGTYMGCTIAPHKFEE